MQKSNYLAFTLLLMITVSLSSCEVIGGIFEAGIWTGLIVVVIVIAIILWLVSRFRRK